MEFKLPVKTKFFLDCLSVGYKQHRNSAKEFPTGIGKTSLESIKNFPLK